MPSTVALARTWGWRVFGLAVLVVFALSAWAAVLVAAYANWRCGWQLRPRATTRVVVLADPQMRGELPPEAPWTGATVCAVTCAFTRAGEG
jgi:hypothetical protein